MITSQADQLSRGLVDQRCPRETQTCRSSHPGQQPHQAPCHPLIITSDHNFLRRSGNMFWAEKFSRIMLPRASCLFGCVMIFSDNAPSLRLPSSSLQPHFRTSHPLPSPPTSHRPNQTSVSAPTSPFARSRLCAFPTLALLCLVQRSDVPQLAFPTFQQFYLLVEF